MRPSWYTPRKMRYNVLTSLAARFSPFAPVDGTMCALLLHACVRNLRAA